MTGVFEHWYYLLILLVIVLIIWGPGKMPDVGAGLGRAIREFRKASSETQDAFRSATTGAQPSSSPSQESSAQAAPAQPVSLQAPPATAPDEPRTSDTPQQQTPVSS